MSQNNLGDIGKGLMGCGCLIMLLPIAAGLLFVVFLILTSV